MIILRVISVISKRIIGVVLQQEVQYIFVQRGLMGALRMHVGKRGRSLTFDSDSLFDFEVKL